MKLLIKFRKYFLNIFMVIEVYGFFCLIYLDFKYNRGYVVEKYQEIGYRKGIEGKIIGFKINLFFFEISDFFNIYVGKKSIFIVS